MIYSKKKFLKVPLSIPHCIIDRAFTVCVCFDLSIKYKHITVILAYMVLSPALLIQTNDV